jgi:uncharacterized protein (TIGR03437 family)
MYLFRAPLLAVALAGACSAANIAFSTYLKDGFTPTAIASDSRGNIYLAGSAVTDPLDQTTGALVAKVNPNVSEYLYLSYIDSAASDQVAAIAIDGTGNAYITGSTTNPNFPVVGAGMLGTPPTSTTDTRSFVIKLNPQGTVVFSALIGGSTMSTASGIALTPQGRILVSGIAGAKGFPATAGAYSVADSTNQWFLMELDSTASTMIFSATGIGGSSIALDAAGNIFLAGSSTATTYPTTPGAYQTEFVQGLYCFGMCQIYFSGNLQHVTKTDAAASKLIYSTGINDPTGGAGSTTNTGLAVDAAGNAYVTGTLLQGKYPLTVTPPVEYTAFTSKLDPAGAKLLFSIPVGGAGVQLDSSGSVYVGGAITAVSSFLTVFMLPPQEPAVYIPPIFSNIPQVCLPNSITSISESYVMKLDPATGTAEDAQLIDGSAPGAAGITLAGGNVWITGSTPGPQVPVTPGVLVQENLGPGFLEGGYLSAVDFATSRASVPVIACVLDGGNLTHVGALGADQLISIFGSNLGPTKAVSAPNGSATLGGVTITFDGRPAQLLYASTSQINVGISIPPMPTGNASVQPFTVMKLTANNASVERQFPLTINNLNLFANLSMAQVSCATAQPSPIYGVLPVATNADGSLNTCAHPALYGSTVSLFVHGAGFYGTAPPAQLNVQALAGACQAQVTNTSLINEFVYKVDLALPPAAGGCIEDFLDETYFPITLTYSGAPVGPFYVPADLGGPVLNFPPPGQSMPMIVYVRP